jgi:tripartite-type tricarboxylate transporter receptor subunit TctC
MKGRYSVIVMVVIFMFVGGSALGQTFPSKPINLWIGWGAGGGTDIHQRAQATIAAKILNQPIICTNAPGAGGILVLGKLKNEKPDGYTIANSSTAALSRIPLLQSVPFNAEDPFKDLVPVMAYTRSNFGIAVKSDSPWKTFEDLVAYAKKNPGKIRYSTTGVGTGGHVAMEFVAMQENIKWIHVPFTNVAETVTSVLGGHVEVVSQTQEWKPYVDSGQMRLLVVEDEVRNPEYPNVPTLMEKGYDFAVRAITVLYAPAGTPKDVLNVLGRALSQAAETDEFKELLKKMGYPLFIKSSDEVIKLIKEDYAANKKVFMNLGIGIFKK